MDNAIIQQLDQRIESAMDDVKRDLIRLIGIRSVKGPAAPGAPFGEGPRQMLDAVLEMGRNEGFAAMDYGVGVVSLALKEGQPDLGIWLHGDVVTEGHGWIWPPYEATEYGDCVIGRGSTDNKGQLCAIFHLLKIFKELGIGLNYNPALYVGSDEESGMHDMRGIPGSEDAKGFCNVCQAPKLSLVPDSGFPAGYGGKGAVNVTLRSAHPLKGLDITAGTVDSPGLAAARIGGETIETSSLTRHSTNPDPSGNMITLLMDRLLERPDIAPDDRPVLEFFRLVSLDIHGEKLGISVAPGTTPIMIVSAEAIRMVDGCAELTVNVRYPMGWTTEKITSQLALRAAEYGVALGNVEERRYPYALDPEWPVITRLAQIANEVTGEDKKTYIVGGGTYAHWLPNAVVYGMDGNKKPDDFPEGHGNPHGPDEIVSMPRLERAMKIYARALLALNGMAW